MAVILCGLGGCLPPANPAHQWSRSARPLAASAKGLLGPQSFLELIDTPLLHSQLLGCLLEQGLKLQRHLQLSASDEALMFSYNNEPGQLVEEGFACRTLQRIEQAGVACRQVTLEATERGALALALDLNSIESICQLVKSGVRLALDDS